LQALKRDSSFEYGDRFCKVSTRNVITNNIRNNLSNTEEIAQKAAQRQGSANAAGWMGQRQ